MKVSEERELLKANHIFNDWRLVGKGGWMLWYDPGGRGVYVPGWFLTSPGSSINGPDRPWYEEPHSLKLGKHEYWKSSDAELAKAEATKISGITDWRRSPFGGYSYVSAARVAKLIARIESKEE